MGKPSHLFRICTNINLSRLKDQLDQINRQLKHIDTRRVEDVEYRRPSIDSCDTMRFNRMKLMNDGDGRCNALFYYLIILLDDIVYVYILYDCDDCVTCL